MSDNINSIDLDQSIWCLCNTNLPSLYRLLLHFSYVYTTCNRCFNSRYQYKYRRYVYEYADLNDDTYLGVSPNEDLDDIVIQIKNNIKNNIKKNPKVLYTKVMNETPLELIIKLDTILEEEDHEPYLKFRHHCKIRGNQHTLYDIQKFAKFEYLKYELVKTVAFRYIKNSNHIGHNAELLQIPLHIWEYIFTFM